jgi:hypothetical protein
VTKILSFAAVTLMLIAGTTQAGETGSSAELGPYAGRANGWVDGPRGFTNSRVVFNPNFQYSWGSAIDTAQGVRTSHSYAIRLPDGQVIANNFNLSVVPGDTYFGSSYGEGGTSASAGGRLYGQGSGMNWGQATPSLSFPAYTEGSGQSFP